MLTVDLNCDMGESTTLWPWAIENDLALLPWLSSVNLACGFHAGDAHTMHRLVDAALEAGVAIGAHPSFPDRENFGRTAMHLSPEQLYDTVIYQLGALEAFTALHGTRLHHVKPHGAMYNMAAADGVMAATIAAAVRDFDPALWLYGLAGSELIKAATDAGIGYCNEVFADRSYRPDGSLTPRTSPGALIASAEDAVRQALEMVVDKKITAADGGSFPVSPDTICLHSDGPHALAFARMIFGALKSRDIGVARPRK